MQIASIMPSYTLGNSNEDIKICFENKLLVNIYQLNYYWYVKNVTKLAKRFNLDKDLTIFALTNVRPKLF